MILLAEVQIFLMAKLIQILLANIFLFVAVIFFPINTYAEGDLYISEVGFMGSSFGGGHDKWVEIFNPTQNTIDLSEYSLIVGKDSQEIEIKGSIQSNEASIISTNRKSTDSIFNYTSRTNQIVSWNPMSFLSNTTTDKHITLRLQKNDYSISNIIFDGIFVENSLNHFANNKGSIECDAGGYCWNSNHLFWEGNYGTPGLVPYHIVQKLEEIVPVAEVIEIVEPAPNVELLLETSGQPVLENKIQSEFQLQPIAQNGEVLEKTINTQPISQTKIEEMVTEPVLETDLISPTETSLASLPTLSTEMVVNEVLVTTDPIENNWEIEQFLDLATPIERINSVNEPVIEGINSGQNSLLSEVEFDKPALELSQTQLFKEVLEQPLINFIEEDVVDTIEPQMQYELTHNHTYNDFIENKIDLGNEVNLAQEETTLKNLEKLIGIEEVKGYFEVFGTDIVNTNPEETNYYELVEGFQLQNESYNFVDELAPILLDVDYLEYLIDNTFYAEQIEPYIEVSQNELHNLEEPSSEVNFNSAQETEFIESIEEGIMDKEVLFESMLETNLVNSFEEEGGFLDLVFEPVLDLDIVKMTYQKFAEDVLITEFQTDLDLDNTTEFSGSKPHQVVTKSIQLDGVKNSILSTNNTHAIEFNEPITNINIVEVAHNLINKTILRVTVLFLNILTYWILKIFLKIVLTIIKHTTCLSNLLN
ncbi:MAG: lamin tail domain-containing protein [Thermales bacterium]|nr:lamin tail domain-containing protein [Thermales bacterium]